MYYGYKYNACLHCALAPRATSSSYCIVVHVFIACSWHVRALGELSIEQKKKDTEVTKRRIREDIKVMNKKFGGPMHFMTVTESQNRGAPLKHRMIFDEYEMP